MILTRETTKMTREVMTLMMSSRRTAIGLFKPGRRIRKRRVKSFNKDSSISLTRFSMTSI